MIHKMIGYARILQFWILILLTIYLSLTSGPPAVIASFSDKIMHGAGYLLLILSCDLAYNPSRWLFTKITLLLVFSIIIEIAQHFIPQREFSVPDILANLTGLIWGLLIIIYLKPKVRKFD